MASEKFKAALDRHFHVSARGSSFSQEIRAGISSFLTMSYILLVNPNILSSAGLPQDKVATSTAMTSCIASLLVGVFANIPVGIAPGMGLNAYLVFSQVLGLGTPVPQALACCMVASILVALLAVIHALSLILHLVPHAIKLAVVVGMGLLLSFIGLQKAGVVVKDEETMVGLGDLHSAEVMLAMMGLVLIATLHYRNIKGSILIGVAATALGYYSVKGGWPHQLVALPTLGVWKPDFGPILALDPSALSAVTAYALVMIFDIGGALYGLCGLAGLVKDGVAPGAVATYLSAAAATALGAATGTTPLIIAAESAVGIKEGGRTGLVAVTVSACFGLSLFLSPILQAVPAVATAPVLVLVGAMMMGEAGHIDWTTMPTAVPAFLTMVIQPFTFSIANGIYAGLLFSLALFFTTGEFIPFFKSLLLPAPSEEERAAVASEDGGVTEPLLIPGAREAGVFSGTPPGGLSPLAGGSHMHGLSPHAHAHQHESIPQLARSSATNIMRNISRKMAADMAASPPFVRTTHDLLIRTPHSGQHPDSSLGTSPAHYGGSYLGGGGLLTSGMPAAGPHHSHGPSQGDGSTHSGFHYAAISPTGAVHPQIHRLPSDHQ